MLSEAYIKQQVSHIYHNSSEDCCRTQMSQH
jgi:hypothetical protein